MLPSELNSSSYYRLVLGTDAPGMMVSVLLVPQMGTARYLKHWYFYQTTRSYMSREI